MNQKQLDQIKKNADKMYSELIKAQNTPDKPRKKRMPKYKTKIPPMGFN